jgi:hypothetical protein
MFNFAVRAAAGLLFLTLPGVRGFISSPVHVPLRWSLFVVLLVLEALLASYC